MRAANCADKMTSQHDVITLLDRFSSIYAHRYGEGSQAPEAGVRINTIRVVTYADHARLDLRPSTADRSPAAEASSRRDCHFPGHDAPVSTAVYASDELAARMLRCDLDRARRRNDAEARWLVAGGVGVFYTEGRGWQPAPVERPAPPPPVEVTN